MSSQTPLTMDRLYTRAVNDFERGLQLQDESLTSSVRTVAARTTILSNRPTYGSQVQDLFGFDNRTPWAICEPPQGTDPVIIHISDCSQISQQTDLQMERLKLELSKLQSLQNLPDMSPAEKRQIQGAIESAKTLFNLGKTMNELNKMRTDILSRQGQLQRG